MKVLTVNIGAIRPTEDSSAGVTGIDKRPVDGPVLVSDPGVKGEGGSGLAGDGIGDLRNHGGSDQAVYAFAREDLDGWERELGHPLANGAFGENLTTGGVDVNGALIGERWRIGPRLLLEVTSARIPCRTFAAQLGQRGWVRRFTQEAAPGAYLRVLRPGEIRAGDAVEVVHRPAHRVTVAVAFRAATTERTLLPEVLAAGEALHPELLESARAYAARAGDRNAERPA
ncbi:MOSC domain-containing protein [Streptomyces lichenis]|uniref:MOSC domain-containing protein n=1 Tax=Streptomyces lichenis TaxID=2306967 RepID=A0ABT0I7D3_9ACTN|nr:MOSC domain-containing protein [Streptomyces lichenis]MCK8677240.1 MOSC domain-containing protein [Streptomyces lichenis]